MKKLALFITSWPLFLISCGRFQSESRSDDWLQPFIERYKGAKETDKPHYLSALDSAFNAHPNPSITSTMEYYLTKSEHLYEYRDSRKTAMHFIDNIINTTKRLATTDSRLAVLGYRAFEMKARYHIEHSKQYDSAFTYLAQANLFRKEHFRDSCTLEYSNTIPNMLFQQQKYEDALKYYFLSLARSLYCSPLTFDRFSLAQNSLNSIGLCYLNLRQTDSAAVYLDSAYNFINNSRRLFPNHEFMNLAAGVVLNTQAYLQNNLSNHRKAEQLYLKSIEMVEKEYPDFSLDTRFALVNLYAKEQSWAKMIAMLDSIERKLDTYPPKKRFRSELYNGKYQYYEALGQYDSAFIYLKKHKDYLISTEENRRQFYKQDLEAQVNARQAVLENTLLTKDISIKKAQLLISVLVSSIAVLAVGFIWLFYKRSSRYVKELKMLTSEITASHEDLQHSFTALEQSHAENKKMLRVVAHDLKNPVWGIDSISKSLYKNIRDSDSRQLLELICNTCKNLLITINDLLPDKSTKPELQKEKVDLSRLLENCTRLLQNRASEKHQKLLLSAQPLTVPANREKIWRVVSNLIHNAIKFSATGSTIYLKLCRQDNRALLSIRDEGIGIPEHIGERIFLMDDITKSRTGTSGETSYGLGLSISKKIIEQHDGHIWFESEVGKGTVFYVSLPLPNNEQEMVSESSSIESTLHV